MKKTTLFLIAVSAFFLAGCASRSLYIGGNDGIHIARYSNHGLPIPRSWSLKKLVDDVNISYMALHKRTLYAARRVAKGVYSVDVFRVRRNGTLKKNDAFVIPGSHGYCHISVSKDGKYLFGSSYSGGFLDVLSLIPDGGIVKLKRRFTFSGASIHKRQKRSHPHFAAQTPDGKMVLVADLGSDRIHTFSYDIQKGLTPKGSVSLPPGSGPRHLSFSADGKFVFAANELNNTVCSFKLEQGKFNMVSVCSLLPQAWSGNSYAGAIRISPCGKLFVTNRGHNSVAAVSVSAEGKLKLENTFSSEGDFPYDIEFLQGELLLVNMKSDQFSVWQKGDEWKRTAVFTLRRPMCIVPVTEN